MFCVSVRVSSSEKLIFVTAGPGGERDIIFALGKFAPLK